MKYNWSNYNLEQRLDELKRLKNSVEGTDYGRLIKSINMLEKYLEQKREHILTKEKPLLESIYNDAVFYYYIDFMIDDILEFNTYELSDVGLTSKFKQLNISKDDILTITHDFFKSQDGEIYKNFLEIYKTKDDHVKFNPASCTSFDDTFQYTFVIPYTREAFIQIHKLDSIQTLTTTMHEYGHAMSFAMNPRHLHDQNKYYIRETDSIFFEIAGSEYLKNQNIFDDSDANLSLMYNQYITIARQLSCKIALIALQNTNRFSTNKELKEAAMSQFGFPDYIVEDYININPAFYNTYVMSFMFAVELYEIYKKDKDLALYKLKKYIKSTRKTIKGYYDEMLDMDLLPNFQMEEFVHSFDPKLVLRKDED